jgi:hypothetical protein
MSKSNVVSPIVSNKTDLRFQEELDELDRFRDLSLLIYEQNSHLYKLHFKKFSHENRTLVAKNSHSMSEIYTNSQQSKVCAIL